MPSITGAISKVLRNPVVAALLTLGLICLTTWIIVLLKHLTQDDRPFTILYILPVAVGGALLGVRGGILVWVTTLLFARRFLFTGIHLISSEPGTLQELSNAVEFAALALGTLAAAVITGRLRSALEMLDSVNSRMAQTNSSLAEMNKQIRESEIQRRAFNRDVLRAVTAGKLILLEADELSQYHNPEQPPVLERVLKEPRDATELRQTLQRLAEEARMDPSRVLDLCTSVTEAATNAINHGAGGVARAWVSSSSALVLIQDFGEGIPQANLARATLEKGYSTRVSLGMGFFLILDTVDKLLLSTGPKGTTLVLTIFNRPRLAEGDALLARFAVVQS